MDSLRKHLATQSQGILKQQIAQSFEQQAPRAYGDIDFFLSAEPAPAPAQAPANGSTSGSTVWRDHEPRSIADSSHNEVIAQQRENVRLEATVRQMQADLQAAQSYRKEALQLRVDEKELRQQLADAQRSLETTSEAANARLKDYMNEEAACLERATSGESRWHRFAEQETESLEASRCKNEQLAAQIEKCENDCAVVLAAQQERNQRRQERLAKPAELRKLERSLALNIAKELKVTREGRGLEKVDQKHNAKQKRLVVVADDEVMLKWGHLPGPLPRNCTRLELKDVIRIEYGRASRAWVLHPSSPPWLCFSLYTTDRSFDFICPDEWIAQCYVLVLSRLCDGVVGSIHSRPQFVARRGWAKIQDSCFKRKKTVARALLEVLQGTPESPERRKNPFTFVAGGKNPFTFVANPFSFVQSKSHSPRSSPCDDDDDEPKGFLEAATTGGRGRS